MLILYQHRKLYLIFNIVKGDGAPAGQRYISAPFKDGLHRIFEEKN